ncbi:H(+)/Cl(-) exchange transporter clcA [Vibrio ishigakensis]|uniref:H(+)/Cl(-) exchange transporter clcA n=1 Tax=Vibrio ishigakensis TaxID=1481914 RepID=A0A0B8QBZ4_9VIBR|nr:H(+)/Cl(-) exchange transporter clcA [Vibrio ishigakensis]
MPTREVIIKSVLNRVPKDAINQFISRDKSSFSVLIMASLVGILAGIVGTYFEIAVRFVSETRTDWLKSEIAGVVPLWLAAILISAALAFVGYFLVHRFAPEAAGSGIPEIEGAMDNIRPVRWWRVLPVKFFGGMGALGSGMVLGREGPTVQMGGAVGRMISDIFRVKDDDTRHSLLASGAAGGLAAAFNAPLPALCLLSKRCVLSFATHSYLFARLSSLQSCRTLYFAISMAKRR